MRINADLSRRAVVDTRALEWVASPQPGVRRRMLERDGGEVARATSVVSYAPGASFAAHTHDAGEEFLVLEGVFSDETGDFPAGTYVRNPPGSSHRPHTGPGCVILVKLRQFDPSDREVVRIDTRGAAWHDGPAPGLRTLALFARGHEQVALVEWAEGARAGCHHHPRGEEMFVLRGVLEDEHGRYPAGTWVRSPPGSRHAPSSASGATIWIKTGHLDPGAGEAASPTSEAP